MFDTVNLHWYDAAPGRRGHVTATQRTRSPGRATRPEKNEYSFSEFPNENNKELGWRYGLGSEVPSIARDLPPKE